MPALKPETGSKVKDMSAAAATLALYDKCATAARTHGGRAIILPSNEII